MVTPARQRSRVTGSNHHKGSVMNRLVDAVAAATGESNAATSEAIDAFIASVTDAVAKGETVELIGFGSFSINRLSRRTSGTSPLAIRCARPSRNGRSLLKKARSAGG